MEPIWRLAIQNRKLPGNGEETGPVDETYNFFNPKAGITLDLDGNNNFYFSYAVANREPNRNDFENGNPRPERLDDFELGWRFVTPNVQLNANLYYMDYNDQLVLTGELNDVGAPLRENIGDSYRFGVEIDATVQLGDKYRISPNIALSSNKNKDFVFQRDGVLQNLGDTNISYSPNLIIGNRLSYLPKENFQISLFTKVVGQQYLGNIDAESSVLEPYSQTDLNIRYEIDTGSFIKSIVLSGLVNNVFDTEYVSDGYFFTFDDDFSDPGTITTVPGSEKSSSNVKKYPSETYSVSNTLFTRPDSTILFMNEPVSISYRILRSVCE